MHILHTVLYKFPGQWEREIPWTINRFFSWSSWTLCVFRFYTEGRNEILVTLRNRRLKSESCSSKRDSCLQLIDSFSIEELLIVHASSESKEYWVPREQVTLGVQDSDTIKYLMDQLCTIFHRSRKMALHKENYPCRSRSNSLMLFNPVTKAEYRFVNTTLKQNKIRNGTRLYLYYSWINYTAM